MREYHDNHSFQGYSLHALIQSAFNNDRKDLLHKIYYKTDTLYVRDDILYLKYITGSDIDKDYFIKIIKSISGTNRRYIKLHFDLYQEILVQNFNEEYGMPYFPFSNIFDVKDDKRLQLRGNANYSLDRGRKEYFKYPFFMQHHPFRNEILRIHKKTHEDVKRELAKRRRSK